MLSYSNLPPPPNLSLVLSILTLQEWLKSPGTNKEPERKDTEAVLKMTEAATTIEEQLREAYVGRVIDTEKGTQEDYFKRLKQLNDTATLITAAYMPNMTREQLLGIDND